MGYGICGDMGYVGIWDMGCGGTWGEMGYGSVCAGGGRRATYVGGCVMAVARILYNTEHVDKTEDSNTSRRLRLTNRDNTECNLHRPVIRWSGSKTMIVSE